MLNLKSGFLPIKHLTNGSKIKKLTQCKYTLLINKTILISNNTLPCIDLIVLLQPNPVNKSYPLLFIETTIIKQFMGK